MIGRQARAGKIRRFVTQRPTRFDTASGPAVVQGASVVIDAGSGRAERVTRIQEYVE